MIPVVAWFRLMLVAAVLCALVAVGLKVTGAGLPSDLLAYKDSHAPTAETWRFWGIYLLSIVAAIWFIWAIFALLLFRMWARELAILSLLISWLLIVIRGPSIESGWTISLQQIACVLWVGAIAMAYSSPLNGLFPGENGS
jgi:hypothetical protein